MRRILHKICAVGVLVVSMSVPIASTRAQSIKSPEAALIAASQGSNYQELESLLAQKVDINARGPFGRTALHLAANNGDAKMVAFLLKHKADVNAPDKDGFPPIIQSIKSREVLQLLLNHGADINARVDGNTILSIFLENRKQADAGILPLLLEHHFDVALNGMNGLAELVTFSEDTKTMELLATHYSNPKIPKGRMLLNGTLGIALEKNNSEMVSSIVSASVRTQKNSLATILEKGDLTAIRSFLDANPNELNETSGLGWTPLHLAAMKNQYKIIEFLLSRKSDPDIRDEDGNTALYWAIFWGNEKAVEILLQHKANLEITGNSVETVYGNAHDTPLDLAIKRGFTPIAALLIAHGASLDTKKWYGETPLHLAVSKENIEVTMLLLAKGADVNVLRYTNQTPLDIAVSTNSVELVQLLESMGAHSETKTAEGGNLFHLWAGKGKGNPLIADQLLKMGCDFNSQDREGKTPLHLAVSTKQKQAIKWLLDHKASIEAKDLQGQTPLHYAVTFGAGKDVVQILLDYHATLEVKDNRGKTPLEYWEEFSRNGQNHGWAIDYDLGTLLGSKGSARIQDNL